mgnify:CR=1 FL=1
MLYLPLDLLHDKALEDVAFLDVIELVDGHTAFVVLRDFLDGVLEALERGKVTFVDVIGLDACRREVAACTEQAKSAVAVFNSSMLRMSRLRRSVWVWGGRA